MVRIMVKRTSIVFLVIGFFFLSSAFGQEPSIKIGFIGQMTGGSAHLGQSTFKGFKMFLDEYNEKGGIRGRRIEVVVDNDEGQPAKSVTAANKQILKDEIVTGWATTNTPTCYAVIPVFKDYEVPHVTQCFSPGLTKAGSNYIFRIAPPVDTYPAAVYEWAAKNMGLKNVAIISDKGAYGQTVGDEWENAAPKYGIKVITRETINLEDKDFTGQLLKIKSLNAQAVAFGVNWELTMGLIAKNMRKLGMDTQIVTGSLAIERYYEAGGKAADGTIVALSFTGFAEPKERVEFSQRFKVKYGHEAGVMELWGFDGANIIALGLERAYPNITRKNVYNGIASLSGIRLLQGVYDFKASQDGFRRAVLVKVVNGKGVLIQE